ncbi:hypothetical protein D3C78_1174520 [compost metagenome]
MFVAVDGVAFRDVTDVENRVRSQEVEALKDAQFFGIERGEQGADRLAFVQKLQRSFHQRQLRQRFLVLAGGALAGLFRAALKAFEIGEHQLGLDGFGIGHGVDAAFDVGDVIILEAAQNVNHGVHFTDIGEELVAEAFALRCTAYQAGDVDEGDAGRDDFLRAGNVGEDFHARIRNRHFAGIRLDGAEGIVGGLCRCRFRQRVEESGLADIWQSNDTAFEAHGLKPVRLKEFVEEPFAERAGQGQARGPIWVGKAPLMVRNFGQACRWRGCGAI